MHRRKLADAVIEALRRGRAEEPEAETRFVLDVLRRRGAVDARSFPRLIDELASGVSPYHALGEYPMPDGVGALRVPRDVMPPGVDTGRVILAIGAVVRSVRARVVADVGCGTGVLGIAALTSARAALGVFVDVDVRACAATRSNLQKLNVLSRALVQQCDGLQGLRPNSVDVVVANLPFVAGTDLAGLAPRFRAHAPRRAIDGGPDGLAVFRHLLPGMLRAMSERARLVLQVGCDQKAQVLGLLGSGWRAISGVAEGDPNIVAVGRTSPGALAVGGAS